MTQNQIIGTVIVALSILVYFMYANKIQNFLDLHKLKMDRNNKKNQAHKLINSISIMLNQIDILEKIKAELGDDIFSSISQTGLNEISKKVESLKSVENSFQSSFNNVDDEEEIPDVINPTIHVDGESTKKNESWGNYKF